MRIYNQSSERDARQLDSPHRRRLPQPVPAIQEPVPHFNGPQQAGPSRQDDPFYSSPVDAQTFLRPNELYAMNNAINAITAAAIVPGQRPGRRQNVAPPVPNVANSNCIMSTLAGSEPSSQP